MNIDGSGQIRLTNSPQGDSTGSWSPDDSKIVWACPSQGSADICLMNADGTGKVNLTNDPNFIYNQPSFSPDGLRIAVQRDPGNQSSIYIMNADGTGMVRVTDNGSNGSSPSWGPAP